MFWESWKGCRMSHARETNHQLSITEFLTRQNIPVVSQPPYSPDLVLVTFPVLEAKKLD